MKLNVEISDEDCEMIARKELQNAILIAPNADESGYDMTDYEMIDRLLYVLSYFSSKDQFLEFCTKNRIFNVERYL
jgi:hypothetical protein